VLTGGLIHAVPLAGATSSSDGAGTARTASTPATGGPRPASVAATADGDRSNPAARTDERGFSFGFPNPFGHITISGAGVDRTGSTSPFALAAGAGILIAALLAIRRSSSATPEQRSAT
jgi:hypothetical protein